MASSDSTSEEIERAWDEHCDATAPGTGSRGQDFTAGYRSALAAHYAARAPTQPTSQSEERKLLVDEMAQYFIDRIPLAPASELRAFANDFLERSLTAQQAKHAAEIRALEGARDAQRIQRKVLAEDLCALLTGQAVSTQLAKDVQERHAAEIENLEYDIGTLTSQYDQLNLELIRARLAHAAELQAARAEAWSEGRTSGVFGDQRPNPYRKET